MMDNTMYLGVSLLSKIIESNDYSKIGKYNIELNDFITDGEKEVFKFIDKYARDNKYELPSLELVEHTFSDIEFQYGVRESYDYLVTNLKSNLAQRKAYELLTANVSEKFETLSGNEFINYLQQELDLIKKETSLNQTGGISVTKDVSSYLDEYSKRKQGDSYKVWDSAFPSLPSYQSGSMYGWYGKSGRGKSILSTVVESVKFAMSGATVLIWSLELSEYEVLSRIYSHLYTKFNVNEGKIEEIDYGK